MTMTYAQFENFALDLKRHSDSIDDDWHIYEHQSSMNGHSIKYLVKKKIQIFSRLSLSSEPTETNVEDFGPIVCEYHILYNSSYSCPDMFYNMWLNDGKLLTLEHVWSVVHSFFQENLKLDKWNCITQMEHPYNNKPFFRLHPCQTTNILSSMGFSSKYTTEFNPIISWLSIISPLIGLEVHLSYGYKRTTLY